MTIAHRILWVIALGFVLAAVACGKAGELRPAPGQGVLSDYATDAGQTFRVEGVFRVNAVASVVLFIVEGHGYLLYDGYREGGIIHSASCPHPVHNDMREIY